MRNDIKEYYNQKHYEYLKKSPGCGKVSMSKWAYSYDISLLSHLNTHGGGQLLLDVGCGPGYMLKVAESIGFVSYGLDLSITSLVYSKRLVMKPRVVVSDAENMPFCDNLFDFVTFIGTLEHFPNPDIAIKEAKRVAKSDAEFLLLVPNSKYILHLLGYKTSHQLFDLQRNLNGWKELFTSNGYKINKIVGDNKHLLNPVSSNKIKAFGKAMIKSLIHFVPLRLSYHYIYLYN